MKVTNKKVGLFYGCAIEKTFEVDGQGNCIPGTVDYTAFPLRMDGSYGEVIWGVKSSLEEIKEEIALRRKGEKEMKKFNYEKIIVHAGIFHADDLFCVAMARRINPDIRVERTNMVPDLEHLDGTIVCDVGGGLYDHHQPDAETRKDGNKFAACGLFFRDFWHLLFPNEGSAKAFERDYIIPIELADNGVVRNPLSTMLASFNPNWDEAATSDEKFEAALAVVETLLDNAIDSAEAAVKAENTVKQALADVEEGVIILPKFMPWKGLICKDDTARFVVFPSLRGGFNLQAVPPKASSMECRIKIPAELKGNDGCTFVHPAGFMAAFTSLEEAVAAGKALVNTEVEQ